VESCLAWLNMRTIVVDCVGVFYLVYGSSMGEVLIDKLWLLGVVS
jgi:hypothetical protein